jgi:prepilin-type N-terminal cleavage/methylation domain-containing protein
MSKSNRSGFTLIELLVVIAIIGILSTVVLASVDEARVIARDSVRISHLNTLRTVIEAYYNDHGAYPATFTGDTYTIDDKYNHCPRSETGRGISAGWHHSNDYVPEVILGGYISVMPGDPKLDCEGVAHSWSYASNGIDYKLITHVERALSDDDPLIDPTNPYGNCDGTPNPAHAAVYSEGARCWWL